MRNGEPYRPARAYHIRVGFTTPSGSGTSMTSRILVEELRNAENPMAVLDAKLTEATAHVRERLAVWIARGITE